MSTHNSFYKFNLTLAGAPLPASRFERILVIVPEPGGFLGSWLNGAGYLDFQTKEALDDALAAPTIDQATYDLLALSFAQVPSGAVLRVVSYDPSVPEDAEDAYDAAVADAVIGDVWAIVAFMDNGSSATPYLNILSKVAASNKYALMVETDEATLASGAISASVLPAFETAARGALTWSNSDEGDALAILSKTLSRDIAASGPAFAGTVTAADGNNPEPTAAQYSQLIANNVNLLSEVHATPEVFMPGVMGDGRNISEVLFADYTVYRLEVALKTAHLRRLDIGEPINVDLEGQAYVEGIFLGVLAEMAATGKIVPGQYVVDPQDIIQTDIDNQKLRFKIQFQTRTKVITFEIDVEASRQPVVQ